MLSAFIWFVTIQAIGMAAFPLAFRLLPMLRDRGYSVSKPLGLLLLGYLSWMLSQIHILPSTQATLIVLLVAMATVSGGYAWRQRARFVEFFRSEWKAVAAAELIFLTLFVGWVLYRAHDPSIDHTEQPMDLSFMNASVRSFFGPPEDPWLRGESISYYYFGHWVMGAKAELTGAATSVAYNLALALVPAMAGTAVFGLVYNMVRPEGRRLIYGVAAGLIAAVLLTFAANLEGALELIRAKGMGSVAFWDWVGIDGLEGSASGLGSSWRPEEFWWWWRSTRVINTFVDGQGIDYTIQEFPFFSFMLGDLHAHVTSIPFVLLFLNLCLGFLSSRDLRPIKIGAYGSMTLSWRPIVLGGTLGLVLGAVAFTNMWDLPVFAATFLGIAAMRSYARSGGRLLPLATEALPTGLMVVGLAFLFFLPYHLSFNSQFSGLHPVTDATTRPVHFFIVWGLFLAAVVPFMLSAFWQTTLSGRFVWPIAAALLLGFLPYLSWLYLHLEDGGSVGDWWSRLSHILPLAVLITIGAYTTLWHALHKAPMGRTFALALCTLGLVLIAAPEMVFVGDIFMNRMNSMFKLYYQGWVVLAAASGFALYHWGSLLASASTPVRMALGVWAAVFVVVLAASLYYPPAAAASKGDLFAGPRTLDGLSYVESLRPAEYRAIQEIRARVPRGSAVLEAVGADYSEAGRVSASTGVPTVLGWPGHELQWRGSTEPFDGREEDVDRIYSTVDTEEAKALLSKYDVDYVYVGHRERGKYDVVGLDKFVEFMDVWFSEGDVVVYRARE